MRGEIGERRIGGRVCRDYSLIKPNLRRFTVDSRWCHFLLHFGMLFYRRCCNTIVIFSLQKWDFRGFSLYYNCSTT
jgi:hypothetical protein